MLKRQLDGIFFSQSRRIVYAIIALSVIGLVFSIFSDLMSASNSIFHQDFLLKLTMHTIKWLSLGYSLFYLMITLHKWLKHSIVFQGDLRSGKTKMKTANIATNAGTFVANGTIIIGFWITVCFLLLYL